MEAVAKIHDDGKSFFLFPYKVYYLDNAGAESDRIIISVPKRIFKRAVKRNLIRRRTREAFRNAKPLFPSINGKDVLLVYTTSEILDYGKISESVSSLLAKIS